MHRLAYLLPVVGMTLAWLMPLHLLPWVAWHSELPVFAGVLLAAALGIAGTLRRAGASARVPVPALAFALVGVGLLALVQALFGIVRFYGDAWTVLLYLLLCATAFVLGYAQHEQPARAQSAMDALAWTLLATGLGCSAIALVQALDVWATLDWIVRTPTLRRSGSNLAQPNQMSTLVLMAGGSLLYLAERERIGLRVGVLAGLVLALGQATTESRTGLVAIASLAGWWFCKGYESRLRTRHVVLALAVVAAGYLAWPPFIEAFHGDGGPELARVNTQVGYRAVVWPQLLEAAAQRPWFGWGARQTSAALASVVSAHPVSEPYTYAHNIVLELVLGFGVPAAIALLGGAALWTRRRWPCRANLEGWYCMALWVPLSVHALLEFPYSYAYLLAPAMFALGLLDGRSQVAQPVRLPAAAMAAVLAITTVLGAWSAFEYVEIEEDFRVARFEAGRIGTTAPDYVRPHPVLLTQLGAMLEVARIVPSPGMAGQQIELAGDVAARFPWPALQNRYALSLALNGQPARAERELLAIRALHGEGTFRDIRQNWQALTLDRYPQLSAVRMPPAPATPDPH